MSEISEISSIVNPQLALPSTLTRVDPRQPLINENYYEQFRNIQSLILEATGVSPSVRVILNIFLKIFMTEDNLKFLINHCLHDLNSFCHSAPLTTQD